MRFRARPVAIVLLIVAAAAVAVIAFINAHPGRYPWAFKYSHDRRAALVARTEGANGLRIHSMSESDREWAFQPHDGTVRFETHDAGLTREFLDLVRIDDQASGGHCLCVGGDEIDVLRGDSVAVSFSVRHGHELRSVQLWPGDAQLTADSAEAVCAWLVAHGVDEESPRKRAERIAAETTARDAAQDALLGPERARALRACPDEAAVATLLAQWVPDATDRIALAVRFLALEPTGEPSGADDAGARAYNSVRGWLWHPDDFAAYVAAFDRLLADETVAATAAYQFSLINGWHGDELPTQGLPKLRMKAARRLISSANDYERECGVELLGQIDDTPEARAILLRLLPPADDSGRPASPATDSQIEAAVHVVAFCDASMIPRLRALVDGAKDRDRWQRERWAKAMTRRIAARAEAPADSERR